VIRLAYILAASHSGSTLLAMLLGSHPDVCTAGELKVTSLGNPDGYRCSCGAPIRSCSFWAGITEDMARRGFDFDIAEAGMDLGSGAGAYVTRLLRPLHRGVVLEAVRDAALSLSPWWRPRLRVLGERHAAFAESICSRRRAHVLVDSSKVGLRLKYLLRNPAFEVTVIRLIRDGRGVALAYVDPANYADATDPGRRGGGSGASRDTERLPVAEAAREWRRSNEEADAIVRSLAPSQWIEVRYEELCGSPNETLARVFTALRVDPERATTDFRTVEHHVIGNGMRLDLTSSIRLDERWRTALTPEALAAFERVAGATNRRMDYR
jgi:hypothetical protein